ncbi:MAG: rod shape-determining protein MreD [Candidatus Brocadiae bacterium]|nr:rod shape-determining protein MreD [Candidatus Brocadiia bacterium]
MNWIVFVLLALVAGAAQLLLAPWLSVGRAAPDFALILVAAVALRTGANTAFVSGWLLGLMRDLSGGSGPGPFALMFLLAAGIVSILRGALFPSRALGMGLGAFVAALAVHFPYGMVLAVRYGTGAWSAAGHAFAIAVLTGVGGALLARPFAKIRGIAGWAPERELLA